MDGKSVAFGILVGALLVVVALPFLDTQAQAQSTTQEIHGWVNKETGILRIVPDPEKCFPAERPLSWNQHGPPPETPLEPRPLPLPRPRDMLLPPAFP